MEDQQENWKVSTFHQGKSSEEKGGGVSNLNRAIGSITIKKENLMGATPIPAPVGDTPAAAQGGTSLQIQNVYCLSDPFSSTPSKPTARKKTGGKTPSRIKPKLVSKQVSFKKPLEEYEDSQSIEFLRTYIPDLMCQYIQAYGSEPQKAQESSHLLQAAQ